jgi:hypothetical protein
MRAFSNSDHIHEFRRPPEHMSWLDPLDPDERLDPTIMVTKRRLLRLAIVAVETGARFQREGLEQDPIAWMLAPRTLFHGADAIEAALELGGCIRGILLHGLGLGLDADPAFLDALLADEPANEPSPLHA